MEGSPNVPTGTDGSTGDVVMDSNGHTQPEALDHNLNDNQFGSQPNAHSSGDHVGGGEAGGSSQGDGQNQDGGSEKYATHNPGGNPAGNDSPAQLSFVTGQDSLQQTDGARDAGKEQVTEESSKRELTEEDCEAELGYAFSTRKKWWILSVIFLVQTSMNFNTSLYSNGIAGISEEFHVNDQVARAGAAIFLVTYGFGCELWAPWSEEFGRKTILQISLFLTNCWAASVGIAPNMSTILVSRAFGGLSTAGGSVTLGMIADMYDSDSQQYAVAFVVFSSVLGSILGPVVGGFIELLPPRDAWRWCTWIQLIFGLTVQLLHLFTVPETRTTIMMDRIAKKRRERMEDRNVYGPNEMQPFKERFSFAGLMETWSRAFKMLICEPIVRILSLLSGVSDAIVFIQIQSMNLVYKQWDFNSWQIGLAFVPIAIGYFIAWMVFIPLFKYGRRRREENPRDEHAQFESRLRPMLWLSIGLPLGLFIFGAGSNGPPLHWMLSMFGTALIGVANFSIYLATIDYMVCAYGPYSASATGGNGLARDLLAGVLTPASIPFYTGMAAQRSQSLMWGSIILAIIATVLVACSWRVYYRGAFYRRNSRFAQELGAAGIRGRPSSRSPTPPQPIPINERSIWEEFTNRFTNRRPRSPPRQPSFGPTSPRGAYMASVHAASRRQSRQNSRNPSTNPSRRNSHDGPAYPTHDSSSDSINELINLDPEQPYEPGSPSVRAQITGALHTDEHPQHPEDYPHAVHRESSVGSTSIGRPS
ncbi:major facilitator superfamily domain-containing protein [Xylaria telfairii]|nr:major facilitator superfamily domain-containing protein [Xylaria telfairii]